MADAVTTQILYDGPGEAIIKLTNVSDGTGEAAVLKVDVSTLSGAPAAVAIHKIVFSTSGMGVDILWDATTDVLAWHIPADMADDVEFCGSAQIVNNAGTGKTGDINLTTVGHTAGDRYAIVLHLRKRDS